jgi:hypothetical protein
MAAKVFLQRESDGKRLSLDADVFDRMLTAARRLGWLGWEARFVGRRLRSTGRSLHMAIGRGISTRFGVNEANALAAHLKLVIGEHKAGIGPIRKPLFRAAAKLAKFVDDDEFGGAFMAS